MRRAGVPGGCSAHPGSADASRCRHVIGRAAGPRHARGGPAAYEAAIIQHPKARPNVLVRDRLEIGDRGDRLDIGGDEPLNLILEVKGIRDESDKAKAQTTRELWVPGVNALGGFGRWHFGEFRDWAAMDEDFAGWVVRLLEKE